MLTKSRPWKTSSAAPFVTAPCAGTANAAAAARAAAPVRPARLRHRAPREPESVLLNTVAPPESVCEGASWCDRLHDPPRAERALALRESVPRPRRRAGERLGTRRDRERRLETHLPDGPRAPSLGRLRRRRRARARPARAR